MGGLFMEAAARGQLAPAGGGQIADTQKRPAEPGVLY